MNSTASRVVVRFQGPRANGMPELHKLTPRSACCRTAGFKVALITDGRMSGASGKVPAAIHVSPEALPGGPLARVQDGDIIRLDANSGTLEALGVNLCEPPGCELAAAADRHRARTVRLHARRCGRRGSRRIGDARGNGRGTSMTIDDIMRAAPIIPVLVLEGDQDWARLQKRSSPPGCPCSK